MKDLQDDKKKMEKRHKAEVQKLKEKIEKLKVKVTVEKELRKESVNKRESERIEHLKLLEELG